MYIVYCKNVQGLHNVKTSSPHRRETALPERLALSFSVMYQKTFNKPQLYTYVTAYTTTLDDHMCGLIAHRTVTARFNVVRLFAYFVALNALCRQLLGNLSGLRWELICSQSSSRLRLDFVPTSSLILFLGLPIRSPYIDISL